MTFKVSDRHGSAGRFHRHHFAVLSGHSIRRGLLDVQSPQAEAQVKKKKNLSRTFACSDFDLSIQVHQTVESQAKQYGHRRIDPDLCGGRLYGPGSRNPYSCLGFSLRLHGSTTSRSFGLQQLKLIKDHAKKSLGSGVFLGRRILSGLWRHVRQNLSSPSDLQHAEQPDKKQGSLDSFLFKMD